MNEKVTWNPTRVEILIFDAHIDFVARELK